MSDKNIIITGFESCSHFYQACIFASMCKKHGLCKDYTMKSFATRLDYLEWLKIFKEKHFFCDSKFKNHKSCPLVYLDNDQYIGGCDNLKIWFRNRTK
tara:strand:- start:3183 stop:3476 length:294 start_codon:yes stop_codon:yes gene_type:complete